jgi:phosphonate transport system permease protein
MVALDMREELLAMRRRRQLYSVGAVLMVVAILGFGFEESNRLNSGSFFAGLPRFFDYPGQIVGEAWSAGIVEMLGLMWRYLPALIETLNIAFVATIIGGALAVLLSFGSTRNLDVPGWVIPVTRRAMDVMRAFPELVIALFLIFLLGGSPVPAMIAVAFHTAGALGKLFSEVNENIDRKPIEGLKAVGGGWLQRMRFAVLPQVAPNYLSYFLLRLEINVRASAILGFVGAGGIGSELRKTIGWGSGSGDDTVALFLLLFVSIIVIDQLSSYFRERLTGAGAH